MILKELKIETWAGDTTNCYIVQDEKIKETMVIDPAGKVDEIVEMLDYALGLGGLPKSNMLKLMLENNSSVVVRPSGTEPKLKIYVSVNAENKELAELVEKQIVSALEVYIG